MSVVYRTSPIKRFRRTKAEMRDLRAGLYEIVKADQPMTVRQVFYQAVVAGLIEKTEAEYNNTIARLLLEMRRAGEIPCPWIADNTRWMIEEGLRRLCPRMLDQWDDDWLTFERTAIQEYQIALLGLPTRPAKPTATSADWPAVRPCVELDAIPPHMLRGFVRAVIEQHVDQGQLEHLRTIEAAEREQLAMFGQQVGAAP